MRTNASGLAPFETERLIGREWQEADAAAAFTIYGDGEVTKGLGRLPEPDLETQRTNLSHAMATYRDRLYGTGFWALERKVDGRIVGGAVVKPLPGDEEEYELGWHLGREFWGQGYATESAHEAIRIAFRHLPLSRICALAFEWNERSLAVMRRLGFGPGVLTRKYYDDELLIHYLTREEWETQSRITNP